MRSIVEDLRIIPHYERGVSLPLFDVDYQSEFEKTWGEKWGSMSSTGRLRKVLVHRPGEEAAHPILAKDPGFFSLPEGPTDLKKMQTQHDNLVQVMKGEGVEVIYLNPTRPLIGTYGVPLRTSCYMHEALVIKGGAIIERPACAFKKGLEVYIAKKMLELGCPILGTIRGKGTFEASNLIWLNPTNVVLAISLRTNQEGIDQVIPYLREAGVQDIHVSHLPGYLWSRKWQVGGASGYFHLDMTFGIAAEGLGVIYPGGVGYDTIQYLKDHEIELVEVSDEELRNDATNVLPLAPGKVVIPSGSPETSKALRKAGVDVLEVDLSEFVKGGGGPTCMTLPLKRD
jgi:N-dimethylarginine dimethylaminohydrolase